MSFDISIYTDVTADLSLDGNSGFGFQATSGDLDGGDRALIVEHMLHVVSPFWPTDKPATEHPPTAVFTATPEGRLFFSRGISTGQTHSGRGGNQLTEIAATSDLEDLSPHVPAQILAANSWSLEPAASTTLDPWYPPLELPSEFELDALLEWASADEQRLNTLALLISALEERETKKTIIVSDALEEVLRWFTLATVFQGEEAAQNIALRAFVEEPFSNTAPFVAVHPEMIGSSLQGAHVIDFTGGNRSSSITPTPTALRCIEWLRSMDPYTTLDAVNMLQGWKGKLGVTTALTACSVIIDDDSTAELAPTWETAIETINAFTQAGMTKELETYLDEISAALTNHTPTTHDELQMAARAAHGATELGVNGYTDAIIGATLEGLFSNPSAAGDWARALNPENTWNWDSVSNKSSITGALAQLISEVPATDIGPLLSLLRPLEEYISPQLRAYGVDNALDKAVQLELQEPGTFKEEMYDWLDGAKARTQLREALVAELYIERAAQGRRHQELLSGTWDFLDPRKDHEAAANPQFSSFIMASRVARSTDPEQRIRLIRDNAAVLNPALWRYALRNVTLPADSDVYGAWIESVGFTTGFENEIFAQAKPILTIDPQVAKKKEVEEWIPIFETLANTQHSRNAQRALNDLHRILEEIPTFMDRANSQVNMIKNAFSFRRKDKKVR